MNRLLPLISLILLAILAVGCGGNPSANETDSTMEMEEMATDNHNGGTVRIPNENGAAIRIISPTRGSNFAFGEQVIVEVATENFPLGEENNHWHVYVNGASWGMIMGGNEDYPLSGLEPGTHEIAVYMSIATHEEYATGDSITITVSE